jgi:hypothetical protein
VTADSHVSKRTADSHVSKRSVSAAATPFAGMATVVDRKRKNGFASGDRPTKYGPYHQPPWVNENTLCHKCKGRGHIARDPACPKNAKIKVESPLELAVMKAVAEDSA